MKNGWKKEIEQELELIRKVSVLYSQGYSTLAAMQITDTFSSKKQATDFLGFMRGKYLDDKAYNDLLGFVSSAME